MTLFVNMKNFVKPWFYFDRKSYNGYSRFPMDPHCFIFFKNVKPLKLLICIELKRRAGNPTSCFHPFTVFNIEFTEVFAFLTHYRYSYIKSIAEFPTEMWYFFLFFFHTNIY